MSNKEIEQKDQSFQIKIIKDTIDKSPLHLIYNKYLARVLDQIEYI